MTGQKIGDSPIISDQFCALYPLRSGGEGVVTYKLIPTIWPLYMLPFMSVNIYNQGQI